VITFETILRTISTVSSVGLILKSLLSFPVGLQVKMLCRGLWARLPSVVLVEQDSDSLINIELVIAEYVKW